MSHLTSTSRRWALAACIGMAALSTAACKGNSTTQIDAGQTFLLGGEQSAPLLVEGRNVGPVPIEIAAEKAGVRTVVATVPPGQLFSKTFGPREVVRVRNLSNDRQAVVAVEFNRDVSQLSMRYER